MGIVRKVVGTAVTSGIQILAGPVDLPIAIVVGLKHGIKNGRGDYIGGIEEAYKNAMDDLSWLPSYKIGNLIAGK